MPTVPTVSSTRARGRVTAESTTAQPPSSSKPDSFFDPNILIAQVQATKADHLDLPDHKTKLEKDVIDDSEESNIIPFSDVPSDDSVPSEQVDILYFFNSFRRYFELVEDPPSHSSSLIQGDTSGCFLGAVYIKTNVAF